MRFIVKENAEYLTDVDNYAGILNYLDFLDLSALSNSQTLYFQLLDF